MSLPLREPFFLRGRTSVVQRAVIMSLVLGGLACSGGWIMTLVALSLSPPANAALYSLGFSGPLVLVTLIYRPLLHWNRTPPQLPFLIVGCLIALIVSLLNCLLPTPSHSARTIGALSVSIHLTVVVVLSGLYLRRNTRLHAAAFWLSLALTPLPIMLTYLLQYPHRFRVPWVDGGMQIALTGTAYLASWLCVMSVPWGIPFWWPPQVPESP